MSDDYKKRSEQFALGSVHGNKAVHVDNTVHVDNAAREESASSVPTASHPNSALGVYAGIPKVATQLPGSEAPLIGPSETDPSEAADADEINEPQQTDLARRLDRLMVATKHAIRSRERLPQPLFWSLFHTEVAEIRKRKEIEQAARIVFLRGNAGPDC